MKKTHLYSIGSLIALLIIFNIYSLSKPKGDSASSPKTNGAGESLLTNADATSSLSVLGINASSTATSTATSSEAEKKTTVSFLAYGKNDHGQLTGTLSNPVIHQKITVRNTFDIARLFAGKGHTLGLTKNGEVISWGLNDMGQLGYKTPVVDSPNPQQIPGLTDIAALATTNNHSLALDKDGGVWSWGRNFTGQLGNGNRTNTSAPSKVAGLPAISKIAAGHKFSLALDKTGSVWAWGADCDATGKAKAKNLIDTLGANLSSLEGGYYDNKSNGESEYDKYQDCLHEDVIKIKSLVPIKLPTSGISQISVGYGHALLLTTGGKVISFGCNFYKQTGFEPGARKGQWLMTVEGLENIVQVAAGARHSAVLDKDGNVYAFGANFAGQLADGGSENRSIPKKIENIPPIKSIVAGFDYTIATARDGSVWAWGGNSSDLLMENVADRIDMPMKLEIATPKYIATGGMHILFQY